MKYSKTNDNFHLPAGARSKPSVSFETSSSTWKNLARIAVLCNDAEFAQSASDDPASAKRVMEREVREEILKNPVNVNDCLST